jgi:hypothetical protein
MRKVLVVLMIFAYANHSSSSTQSQTKTTPTANCSNVSFSAEPPLDKLVYENDPEKQIAQLDELVAKLPKSDLLVYVYPLYCDAYRKMRNFPMVMEYADKVLALGSKATVNETYNALRMWTAGYNGLNSDDAALAAKALARSTEGIEVVSKLQKTQCVDANTFELQKRLETIYFHATAGAAAMKLKNDSAAFESLRAILTLQDTPLPSASQPTPTSN